MKKSIIISIMLIYVASIIVVGFFGISVKVYDQVKYVQSITMSVNGADETSYKWEDTSPETGGHSYTFTIYFSHAQEGPIEDKDGNTVIKKYLAFTFLPQITYMSGDLGAEEKIKYILSDSSQKKQDKGYFTLNEYGVLTVFQSEFAMMLYIKPESSGSIDAEAKITIICVDE